MIEPRSPFLDHVVRVMQYLSLLTETLIYTALIGAGGMLVDLGWYGITHGEFLEGFGVMIPVLVVSWVGAKMRNGR